MFPEDIWYILPNFHFMFFDRYEIHIQAFVDFIYANLSFFEPRLTNLYNEYILILILSKNKQKGCYAFRKIEHFQICRFSDMEI